MVVVGGEEVVGEELGGITGAPFVVHHLDVEEVVGGDAEGRFSGTDTLEFGFHVTLGGSHKRGNMAVVAG